MLNLLNEVQATADFLLELLGAAEDVRVVLVEAADAREAREAARGLVAVERGEVGEAQREVPVATQLRREDQAVRGTIHRLQPDLRAVDPPLGRVVGAAAPPAH